MSRTPTKEHKANTRAAMLKASKEGRLKGISKATRDAREKMGNTRASLAALQAGRDGNKGVPQNMDKLTGAHENNCHGIEWEIKSPDGITYSFRNLNNFIRENSKLFDAADTKWVKSHCRASLGLHRLNQIDKKTGLPRCWSWKGWRGSAV